MVELIADGQMFRLTGSLTYESVSNLLNRKVVDEDLQGDELSVDCDQLEHLDSAGLALLLQWFRACQQYNKKLTLNNLPAQAQSIIKANKLEGFFD